MHVYDTFVLPGASIRGYIHHVAARRTEIRLKRRHGATPVPNFAFESTTIAARVYDAISREATIIGAAYTIRDSMYVVALSMRILVMLQRSPFPN